ncbi:hypothetical protein [Streptosporangium sp. NPDC000509]|uniref:hypothetical protein n=1 Tax=Streptosporangium sp. NPDC000509 TaxID=3366186 RepID=UPI0036C68BE8
MRGGDFRREAKWAEALKEMGIKGLHFHDLRHTGNTLAAQSGASLADLKARMGHDSGRAADLPARHTRRRPEDRPCAQRALRRSGRTKMTAWPARWSLRANGTLMARTPLSLSGKAAF